MMATTEDSDWDLPYSGDEAECVNQVAWEPSAAKIFEMYQTLDAKGTLNIEWQCPGRRSPSHHANEIDSVEGKSLGDEESVAKLEPNEFDFDDEFGSQPSAPKITPRRRTTPASNTQKRVASFDKVMFDIVRYRKLDELESKKGSASSTQPNKTTQPATNSKS